MRHPAARLLKRRHLTPSAYPSPLVIMPETDDDAQDRIFAERTWPEADEPDGGGPVIEDDDGE